MDVEIEKPHVHHQSTGNRHLDFILPISALFVSLVSIGIAWHHSQIMRELVHENERIVEAESLPYLEIYTSDFDDDRRTPSFRMTVQNQGVGPARIAEISMNVNGRPVPDFTTAVDRCCAPGLLKARGVDAKQYRGIQNGEVILSSLRDRMIRPGEAVNAFEWRVTEANQPIIDRLKDGFASNTITISLCYCSVFGECWTRTDDDRRPTPVKECPIAAVPYRQ